MVTSKLRKHLMRLCRGNAQPNSSQETEDSVLADVQHILAFDELDPNFQVKGHTPLCEAIRRNFTEIIKLLIESGADVNLVESNGTSPLYVAASHGNMEVVEMLCNYGADVNYSCTHCMTPLATALVNEHIEIAEYLINVGADANVEINVDYPVYFRHIKTPLDYAILTSNLDLIDMVLDAGAVPCEIKFILLFQSTTFFRQKWTKISELLKKMVCLGFKPKKEDIEILKERYLTEPAEAPEPQLVECINIIVSSTCNVPPLKVLSRNSLRVFVAKSADRRPLLTKLKELELPSIFYPSLYLKRAEDEFL